MKLTKCSVTEEENVIENEFNATVNYYSENLFDSDSDSNNSKSDNSNVTSSLSSSTSFIVSSDNSNNEQV